MRIVVTGPAAVFDEAEAEITDAEILKKLDGREYTEEPLSKYFDDDLDNIGITGGTLRLNYDPQHDRLMIAAEFAAPRKLKPKELKRLVEEVEGQWSDGEGENGPFDESDLHVDLWPISDEPLPEIAVEQIDDGVKVEKPRKSPLLNLAKKGDVAKLAKKLDAGEDPNVCDKYGFTPLHIAISEQQTEAALLLIERGADIEAFDGMGFCPLTTAAIRGDQRVAEALLNRGADVDRHVPGDREDAGYSPLKMACNRNQFAVARLLIAHGADVNLRDFSGYTPLMMLDPDDCEDEEETKEMVALARLMIEKGADPEAKNEFNQGISPALKKQLE